MNMTKFKNIFKSEQLNVILRNYSYNIKLNDTTLQNPSVLSVTRKYCERKLKCWKCGLEKNSQDIFCAACKIIQKPPSTNSYFKILKINETYDIDVKELIQKFRNLQSQIHPDKYSNKPQDEKDISQEYSSILNRAYTNLLSPLQRGLHLLSLKGETILENENTSSDKDFLSEIMEINEEVEEADTPEKLLELNKKNREILENITKELSSSFNNDDVILAKKILIRMKYYNSISKQINNLLREKGIVE